MKNNLLRSLAMLMAVCLVVVSTPVMPARAAATVFVETIPVNDSFELPNCTGGLVTGQETGFIREQVTLNSSGGGELHINAAVRLSGSDNNGVNYVGSISESVTEHVAAGETVTEEATIQLVAQGSHAQSLYVHILVHATLNADGSITSNFETISDPCGAFGS